MITDSIRFLKYSTKDIKTLMLEISNLKQDRSLVLVEFNSIVKDLNNHLQCEVVKGYLFNNLVSVQLESTFSRLQAIDSRIAEKSALLLSSYKSSLIVFNGLIYALRFNHNLRVDHTLTIVLSFRYIFQVFYKYLKYIMKCQSLNNTFDYYLSSEYSLRDIETTLRDFNAQLFTSNE